MKRLKSSDSYNEYIFSFLSVRSQHRNIWTLNPFVKFVLILAVTAAGDEHSQPVVSALCL